MPTLFRIYKDGQQQVQGWTRTAAITGTNIDSIPDGLKKFSNAKFATSVPSPFARMHLFETAFKFVKTTMRGDTPYHEFVSECLDMFELIFYNGNNSNAIKYKVWDRNRVDKQKNPSSPFIQKSANLADALDGFLNDTRFKNLDSIILIYYVKNDKEYLIGGTSPLTYFYVSPNWKKKGIHDIATTGKDILFQRGIIKALSERNEDFQEYMRRFFINNGTTLRSQMPELYNYLDSTFRNTSINPLDNTDVKTIHLPNDNSIIMSCCGIVYEGINPTNTQLDIQAKSDFIINPTKPIKEGFIPLVLAQGQGIGYTYLPTTQWQGNTSVKDLGGIEKKPLETRILPNTTIQYPYLTIGDFLQTELIKLPFKIDKEKFMVGTKNMNLDIDFLLPIKTNYFDYFTLDDLDNQLFIIKNSDGSISVSLEIPIRSGIITLKQEYKEGQNILDEKLNIGIYPFYKITDQTNKNRYAVTSISEFKDMYNLNFRKIDGNFDDKNINYNEVRTEIENYAVSHSYLLKGDYFDIIQVEKKKNSNTRGIIIPQFETKEVSKGMIDFTFAIDFGTTNTFVAYSSNSTIPQPLELTNIAGIEAIFLNNGIDNFGRFTESKILAAREFPPSKAMPSNMAAYPIRTATVEFANFMTGQTPKILGNIGIGYLLEADTYVLIPKHTQYTTNLKWLFENTNARANDKIEAFFEQILWAIKNKIIVSDGKLTTLKIFWLTPKSMSANYRNQFNALWQTAFTNVFDGLNFQTVMQQRSESTAPYLSLLGEGWTPPATNAVNIDIGGGTTDIIFIVPSKSENYITSFRFAGDDIWGETEWGTSQQINNGFVKYLDNTLPNKYNYFIGSSSINVMNRAFKYKELKVATYISQNDKLKAVLFLHYSAIIYHVVQFMQLKNIKEIGRISLTGKGSEYLEMLGNNENISTITKRMVEVFSVSQDKDTNHSLNANGLQVIKHQNPKEVTAKGVIYESINPSITLAGNLKDDMLSGTLLPTSLKKDEFDNQTFAQLSEKKQEIFENVKHFITLLTTDKAILKQCKDLGIDIAIFNDTDRFMQIAKQSFENMAVHRKYNANQDKELEETLFFWALKQPIYDYAQ